MGHAAGGAAYDRVGGQMVSKPLVSVLMGVYYRRPEIALLERSVRSILDQSISDLELLICDDGSSHEARKLLDRMAEEDGRLRFIRPGNLFSLPSKLNACLKASNGDWIARMDDDDHSRPRRLEKQLDYLSRHPEIAFVGCNVNLCRDGRSIGVRRLPEYPGVRDFYFVQPYIHPTLIFRKDILSEVGGYSEDPRCLLCEDYDLLLRLYATGYHGANLQEILFDYTVPSGVKGNRKMIHRWNETVTRYRRFKELKILHQAWPYVLKPLAVGLVPGSVLSDLKDRRIKTP